MKRRLFLRTVGGATAGMTVGLPSLARAEEKTPSDLPRRELGRTGLRASIVTFPGLSLMRGNQQECTAVIHDAVRRGVNYFDVAPAYGKDGECEIKMGVGLQDIKRSDYLLACKTRRRDKEGARDELERSLKRLKTDHFDVYQLHCLRHPEEVKEALGPGGAMETFLEAKEEGKVRHLGFSAHTTVSALEAMKQFRFDTVMFPITFVEWFLFGFGKPVVELAAEQGAAVLGMKMLCRGDWPKGVERTRRWWYRCVEDKEEIKLAVRFTLSQPAVVTGICPSFFDLFDQSVEAGKSYEPITDDETSHLRDVAQTCESLFESRQKLSDATCPPTHLYAGNPHEGCPGGHA
ncbi:MAG: aldo/keto reductase [Pirellulaceae bacterium]